MAVGKEKGEGIYYKTNSDYFELEPGAVCLSVCLPASLSPTPGRTGQSRAFGGQLCMNIQYDSSYSGCPGACFEVRHEDYFVLASRYRALQRPISLSRIFSMETFALFMLAK